MTITKKLDQQYIKLKYFTHTGIVIIIDFDIFYRHVLASLHFNENVKRQTHQSKDGSDYIKVTYPKFNVGEGVVREVAVPPTYRKNTKSSHFH